MPDILRTERVNRRSPQRDSLTVRQSGTRSSEGARVEVVCINAKHQWRRRRSPDFRSRCDAPLSRNVGRPRRDRAWAVQVKVRVQPDRRNAARVQHVAGREQSLASFRVVRLQVKWVVLVEPHWLY